MSASAKEPCFVPMIALRQVRAVALMLQRMMIDMAISLRDRYKRVGVAGQQSDSRTGSTDERGPFPDGVYEHRKFYTFSNLSCVVKRKIGNKKVIFHCNEVGQAQ